MSKKNKYTEKEKKQETTGASASEVKEGAAEEAQATADNAQAEETEAPADDKAEDKDKEKELEAKVAELQDKYLRQVAEFDNFRKRTLKEKSELILNGGEKVISALLPILDDFERADKNLNESTDLDALKEGVNLIFQKLQKVLESQGLKKIETKDQDFNTDYHEAIAMIPAPRDDDKGKVLDCVQNGYMLNEKVIRHAKVAIGQ